MFSSDFFLHFNHDKTILSGEYGVSITMDQALGNSEIIKSDAITDIVKGSIIN